MENIIYTKIKDLILTYRKNKDYYFLPKVTALQSDILNSVKALKLCESEITDKHCIPILNKYIRNIDECIKYTPKEDFQKERELYINLLPPQLTDLEIISLIKNHTEIKSLMSFLKNNYEGRYTPSKIPILFKEHYGN